MARVAFGDGTGADFDRILAHLHAHEAQSIDERIATVIDGCGVLARHPLIGRRRDDDKRELVIGSGAKGYVALYRYIVQSDLVLILAIKAQREKGFAPDR